EGSLGRPVRCPACGAVSQPASAPPSVVRFACACGQQMQTSAAFAGRPTQCPRCRTSLIVPASGGPPPARPASTGTGSTTETLPPRPDTGMPSPPTLSAPPQQPSTSPPARTLNTPGQVPVATHVGPPRAIPVSTPRTTPATDRGDRPGETLPSVPGYELLGELGRGGMGVVYKARQKGLNRTVALKMILAGSHAGEAERARFRREAAEIAKLRHENVVQIYEVGEHEGKPFFSLEYLEGGSLDRLLSGTPQPPRETAALVEKL